MTRNEQQAIEKLLSAKLPCSVTLPPATIVRAGCTLGTLIIALQVCGLQNEMLEPVSVSETNLRADEPRGPSPWTKKTSSE